MERWHRVGRPGALGSRKKEVVYNYDKVYHPGDWRLVWDINGRPGDDQAALVLYDAAYAKYFEDHVDELEWIAEHFSDVFDNNISNVNSGSDYSLQEFGGNHYQDIAIRRCMIRKGWWFQGNDLLEIRMKMPGAKWSPANIPFHKPDFIPKPELPGDAPVAKIVDPIAISLFELLWNDGDFS